MSAKHFKRVLVTGVSGQVGGTVVPRLVASGYHVIATEMRAGEVAGCGAHETVVLDLSKPETVAIVLSKVKPDLVINPAAYTQVDKAESEKDVALAVNATSVGEMAAYAKSHDIPLIHFSTDYVYSGEGKQPWLETAPIAPPNYYGLSKSRGDEAVLASGCAAVILRTSWVYAVNGANFLRTMLRLAKEKTALSVVSDQWGAPTSARLLAEVTEEIMNKATGPGAAGFSDVGGVYHVAPSEFTNWYAYAYLIFSSARKLGATLAIKDLTPIASSAYPTPARRPLNSRLSTAKITALLGHNLIAWDDDVREHVKLILQQG